MAESIYAFFLAVFFAQIANNALQVTLPLMLLEKEPGADDSGVDSDENDGRGALLAFVSGGTNAADAIGTIIGGWLISKISPRAALVIVCSFRCLILGFVAVLRMTLPDVFHGNGVYFLVFLYLVDALCRGITDTARTTVPLLFANAKEKDKLDQLNAKYQVTFEAGVLVGPLLVGVTVKVLSISIANWVPAAVFLIATMIYSFTPTVATEGVDVKGKVKGGVKSPVATTRMIASFAPMYLPFFAIVCCQTHRLKTVTPALFVKKLMGQDESITAWIVACYGVGGILGSSLYHEIYKRFRPHMFLLMSSFGILLIAWGWMPPYYLRDETEWGWVIYGVSALVFVIFNVFARLAMRSSMQKWIPKGSEGMVMGLSRFSEEMGGLFYKLVIGGFCSGMEGKVSYYSIFVAIGGFLCALMLGQLYVWSRLQLAEKQVANGSLRREHLLDPDSPYSTNVCVEKDVEVSMQGAIN